MSMLVGPYGMKSSRIRKDGCCMETSHQTEGRALGIRKSEECHHMLQVQPGSTVGGKSKPSICALFDVLLHNCMTGRSFPHRKRDVGHVNNMSLPEIFNVLQNG
jgi:hypothetical protein